MGAYIKSLRRLTSLNLKETKEILRSESGPSSSTIDLYIAFYTYLSEHFPEQIIQKFDHKENTPADIQAEFDLGLLERIAALIPYRSIREARAAVKEMNGGGSGTGDTSVNKPHSSLLSSRKYLRKILENNEDMSEADRLALYEIRLLINDLLGSSEKE
jgi:hypothetical protein